MVTGDELGFVRVWDPRTGERVHAFPTEQQLLALDTRDGMLAAFARDRQRVWKLAPETVVRRIEAHTARIRWLSFGPDGTLYTASLDGTGAAIDVARGTLQRLGNADGFIEAPSRTLTELAVNARANPRGARSLALSADNRMVALATDDGRIAPVRQERRIDRHLARTHGACAARDLRERRQDRLFRRRHDAARVGRRQRHRAQQGHARRYRLGYRDARRYHARDAGRESAGRGAVASVRLRAGVAQAAAGEHPPRARRDARSAARRQSDEYDLLDASGTVIHSTPQTLAFSADANDAGGLAVGSSNGRIVLYGGDTLAPVRDLQFGTLVITRVAFRPDGKLLAAISERRLQLFDPVSGRLLAQLPELPVLLSQLAWSPDGRYVAVAGTGGTVWVWDVAPADARELETFGACVSPWRLDDTTLVKKPFAPETCSVLARPQ